MNTKLEIIAARNAQARAVEVAAINLLDRANGVSEVAAELPVLLDLLAKVQAAVLIAEAAKAKIVSSAIAA